MLKLEGEHAKSKSKDKLAPKWDTNSSFFHKWINRRNKKNEIVGVHYNDRWLKGADSVKEATFDHFRKHFSMQQQKCLEFSEELIKTNWEIMITYF